MTSVATMNIKDPTVHADAQRLAARRGVSLTEAVRQAVDEALRRDRATDEGYVARAMAAAREIREAANGSFLTDQDLYDDDGLPR